MPRPELVAALAWWIAPPSGEGAELLQWHAPPPCPTRGEFESALASDLGRPLEPRDAEAVTADATARRRSDGRWELDLTLKPRDAPAVARTVVAERCELLAEAAALMIAVAIDPALLTAGDPIAAPTSRAPEAIPLEPDPIPEPPLREPAPDSPAPPPPPPPVTPVRSPIQAAIGFGGGLDTAALPRPTAGLALRLGLLTRRVRVEIGAVHWFEQRARIAGTDAGADLRLTAGTLAACPRFTRHALELAACAGLELGAMRGRGVGLHPSTTDRIAWLAVLADGRLLWAPGRRFALGLQLGLAAPLLAARFRVQGLEPDLHRAAPVAFRGGFIFEVRIP